jgi:hypothetical protein
MIDPNKVFDNIISLLNQYTVEYKSFSHREALTWGELEAVQKETGFFGTEMKCMVLKAGDKLIVYITLQGKRINFDAIKERLAVNKVRLSTPEELDQYFGAKPGCAYPFGFDSEYDIYIDPAIYQQDWLLFSPALPTQTVQAKGTNLKVLFESLQNKVQEVTDFNQ